MTREDPKRTPEQIIKERAAAQAAYLAKEKRLEQDIANTFSTPSGRRTLQYLMKVCGVYANGSAQNENKEMSESNMIHLAALRDLYVKRIRPFIDRDTKIAVEIDGVGDEKTKPTKIKKKGK